MRIRTARSCRARRWRRTSSSARRWGATARSIGGAAPPRGRPASLLTAVPAVTEKESDMASVDLKDKYKEFTDLLGGEALAKSVIESAEAVEKKAGEMGLRRKEANAEAGGTGGGPRARAPP